jgi:hypothetical protein
MTLAALRPTSTSPALVVTRTHQYTLYFFNNCRTRLGMRHTGSKRCKFTCWKSKHGAAVRCSIPGQCTGTPTTNVLSTAHVVSGYGV